MGNSSEPLLLIEKYVHDGLGLGISTSSPNEQDLLFNGDNLLLEFLQQTNGYFTFISN